MFALLEQYTDCNKQLVAVKLYSVKHSFANDVDSDSIIYLVSEDILKYRDTLLRGIFCGYSIPAVPAVPAVPMVQIVGTFEDIAGIYDMLAKTFLSQDNNTLEKEV